MNFNVENDDGSSFPIVGDLADDEVNFAPDDETIDGHKILRGELEASDDSSYVRNLHISALYEDNGGETLDHLTYGYWISATGEFVVGEDDILESAMLDNVDLGAFVDGRLIDGDAFTPGGMSAAYTGKTSGLYVYEALNGENMEGAHFDAVIELRADFSETSIEGDIADFMFIDPFTVDVETGAFEEESSETPDLNTVIRLLGGNIESDGFFTGSEVRIASSQNEPGTPVSEGRWGGDFSAGAELVAGTYAAVWMDEESGANVGEGSLVGAFVADEDPPPQ